MNETEHLLTCLAEEAAEVVQACTKALRFGLEDGYPGTGRTNVGDLELECAHMQAVREMLFDAGVLAVTPAEVLVEKRRKVREHMIYAYKTGALVRPERSRVPSQ